MKLGDYARELMSIGRFGLSRQARRGPDGRDETVYLDRLEENVSAGRSPASALIERWEGEWARDIHALIAASAYR